MARHRLGLDIGSTTVKAVVIDEDNKILLSEYVRHCSDARGATRAVISKMTERLDSDLVSMVMTGSGALSLSQSLNVTFQQEVIAAQNAVNEVIDNGADVILDLGGEDAKIVYLGNNLDSRMNGACAGGTGAYIDQMATLLGTDAMGLNELAKGSSNVYSIAARCGVFAKTDIQTMLNEGVSKSDIAVSIFQSIVMQTIGGLARGRKISGRVVMLGGPLSYLSELRNRFQTVLGIDDSEVVCPPNAHLFVALGAAISARNGDPISINAILARLDTVSSDDTQAKLDPLFRSNDEYEEFKERHARFNISTIDSTEYCGPAYLGIDAGSTTLKMVLIDKDGSIINEWYSYNDGDLVESVKVMLVNVYTQMPKRAWIANSVATGYGENFLIQAIKVDSGIVETIAHLRASEHIMPDGIDSILDIGGQDMKHLRIRDGVIDEIILNEACSSGCGSFWQTFATSLGMTIPESVAEAIQAQNPVDLGTRCTVFMNSSVKHAQKEGATVGDIMAGLGYSIVKNAFYKVLKLRNSDELGRNIMVQGGMFMNDAILRAFELELGRNVIRTNIAPYMGAYGAALIAKDRSVGKSSILDKSRIESMRHERDFVNCKQCANACKLTVNKLLCNGDKARTFITGNRCTKGAGETVDKKLPNLYKFKLDLLSTYVSSADRTYLGTVGLPMALNMFENYPFWFTFFDQLGYRVVRSNYSTRKTYDLGADTIPSDTVCYPAKLAHGHIAELLDQGVDFIFMPCIRYERQEDELANNHFNCPVVMGYPELLSLNIERFDTDNVPFLRPYIPYDTKRPLKKRLLAELSSVMPGLDRKMISRAVEAAWAEDARYHSQIHDAGQQALDWLKANNRHGVVLAGRPYHIDPEVNHGIADMITSLGWAVLTEDSVAHMAPPERPLRIVDQWMYHSRLYAAARLVANEDCLDLIQLVSFGCGLDAITSDQIQEILKKFGKLYTQIKIDEISNIGSGKIRVRSLMSAQSPTTE